MLEHHYLSVSSQSQHFSVIMAFYYGFNGGIDHSNPITTPRFGQIQYFFQHSMNLAGFINDGSRTSKQMEHTFAKVKCYSRHPREHFISHPVKVLANEFEPEGAASFIPMSRIACRCAVTKTTIEFDYGTDSVTVVCPLFTRYFKV